MRISLERVKGVLRREDIEGYIEYHGAPDDEYDSEAEEIARLLNELDDGATEEEILSVIVPVWVKFFNLDEADMEKRMPYIKKAVQVLLSEEGGILAR